MTFCYLCGSICGQKHCECSCHLGEQHVDATTNTPIVPDIEIEYQRRLRYATERTRTALATAESELAALRAENARLRACVDAVTAATDGRIGADAAVTLTRGALRDARAALGSKEGE